MEQHYGRSRESGGSQVGNFIPSASSYVTDACQRKRERALLRAALPCPALPPSLAGRVSAEKEDDLPCGIDDVEDLTTKWRSRGSRSLALCQSVVCPFVRGLVISLLWTDGRVRENRFPQRKGKGERAREANNANFRRRTDEPNQLPCLGLGAGGPLAAHILKATARSRPPPRRPITR